MEQLSKLITSLRAFTIVIIENAFIYEIDAEKVLAKFCFLPQQNRDKILKFLTENGNSDLAQSLGLFITNFFASNRNVTLENDMPATEYFKKYLAEINATTLNEDNIIAEIDVALKADDANTLKDLFLKFGIYSSVNEAGYEDLIKSVGHIENVSISIYKAQPTDGELESFFQHIDSTCEETKSEFCLAIIDKKLSTGVAEDEGKSFIKEYIIPRNEENKTKIICCLYTSQPDTNLPLDSFTDYFVQEIGKDAGDKYEQITKTLARSAYAQVFHTLKLQYQMSAENALKMVLKNQKNIKYIIEHSHLEGIAGIEAIKYWFNLAQQYQFELEEINALNFFAGIINFFENEYLDNHPHIGEIGPELKELNSFDLFDKNVNLKFSPIAPGDIWEIEGNYYILMGQLCDLLLRKNNERNAKLGELLKLEVIDLSGNEKFSIEIQDGKKYISIQNFPLEDGSFKKIVIDVSTKTIEFADLSTLDLVMFNEKGEATININLNGDLSIDSLKVLPRNITDYYKNLIDKYIALHNLKTKINEDITLLISGGIKFSSLNFSEQNGLINLGFRRVGRLKGRYFDSVYNNFLNNKGRIDLNLIDNSPEHVSTVKLTCAFAHDENSQKIIENVNLWLSGGVSFFKKEELLKVIPENYKSILHYCPDNLPIGAHQQYDIVKNDEENFEITFKYLTSDKNFQGRKDYSYKFLFGESKPTTNENFKVEGEEDTSFKVNEHGHATIALTIEQLKKGVTVYEKNVKLQLINGILTRTNIEESAE